MFFGWYFWAAVDQGKKKWMKGTPAMAEGLGDRVLTIKELMTFGVPIQ
jgi:hypothetical protein